MMRNMNIGRFGTNVEATLLANQFAGASDLVASLPSPTCPGGSGWELAAGKPDCKAVAASRRSYEGLAPIADVHGVGYTLEWTGASHVSL
jgi:hypothetical protein